MTTTAPDVSPALAAHTLRPLFAPRAVAVVGASSDPAKLGGVMAAVLATSDLEVAPVNPRSQEMFPSLQAAVAGTSQPLDLAVVCVPAPACPDVLRECGRAGVAAALVCAGGFAETGGEGTAHQQSLLAAAADTGVRLLGPNTSGFFVPGAGPLASFVPGVSSLRAGNVAIVASSGGLNHALAFALERQGTGISLGVGIGAGLDVAAPEVLDYLTHDAATTAVLLHLEAVSDGPGLLAAVRRLAAIKPVVALVVGRNDIAAFAQSHTGALATSWRTTRALLSQAGAVVVDDADELVVAGSVLAQARLVPHPGAGIGLVTAQAGPGLLITDALHTGEVSVPKLSPHTRERLAGLLPAMTFQANPVDTGRPGPAHPVVVKTVSDDPGIQAVGVYALTEPVVDLVASALPVIEGGSRVVLGIDGPSAEIEMVRQRARAVGVPIVTGPRALAVALTALSTDARQQYLLSRPGPGPGRVGTSGSVLLGALSEAQTKALLGDLGVPVPRHRVCRSAGQVADALSELGGAVVVKVSSPGILHKSDIGGVRLGIREQRDAIEAYAALAPLSDGEVLVEVMAAPGLDLILGARRDPVFGPVVVVGIGGTATEVFQDVAVASYPAAAPVLEALPARLQAGRALRGFRGGPPVDPRRLAEILTVLGDLLLAHPEVEEVEINPLRATGADLVALDAVLISTHPRP
ncbi:acetate--CoA ligase family protein [Kineosporia sp. NBRC 101731]|uniref:acetate--CoA ligase family protein n=1 Tax=Kineosporia sp. NBRC 101731 TaxID=3032199 RepID=UPI0024A12634|nr:acetate--CoA ligase family protein [Kineosporia sp. NBRC 101731]GLY29724.1 acyl-CoA synthetase [Kineosporia sp. NBRC 101731]